MCRHLSAAEAPSVLPPTTSLIARLVPVLLLVSTLCGCAQTRTLAPDDARAEVNRRAEGRTLVVTLRSGERVEARAFQVDADSASWLGPDDSRLRRVGASDVAAVTHYDVRRGAADGFWIGLATGLVSGAAVFVASDTGEAYYPWVRGVLVGSMGVAGAGYGTLAGTLKRAPVTYRLGSEGGRSTASLGR